MVIRKTARAVGTLVCTAYTTDGIHFQFAVYKYFILDTVSNIKQYEGNLF